MRAFKTRTFCRWALREALPDRELCRALREMQAGLIDAHLGGGLIKKRIRRAGQGKRGSYRTLVATNLLHRWIFMHGFAKSERSNIDAGELVTLKRLASAYLGMDTTQLQEALKRGELVEIEDGE